MNNKIVQGLVLVAVLLAGCTNDNQTNGAVIGGIAGGVLGSAFGKDDGKVAAGVIGAIAGTIIGSHIGAKMDQKDRDLANQSANSALNSSENKKIIWANPDSGNSGSVQVINNGQDQAGRPCRKLEQKFMIDGKEEKVYMDVCKNDQGQWYAVN
jgi:surface antigen